MRIILLIFEADSEVDQSTANFVKLKIQVLFKFFLFQVKNATQKANLLKLKNFVLVKFLDDGMVDPRDSEVLMVLPVYMYCVFYILG